MLGGDDDAFIEERDNGLEDSDGGVREDDSGTVHVERGDDTSQQRQHHSSVDLASDKRGVRAGAEEKTKHSP